MARTTGDWSGVVLRDRYRCTDLLKGGDGVETYLGEDLTTGAAVVVKLVESGRVPLAVRLRLEHEAAVLAHLEHGDFRPLLDFASDGERLFLVQPRAPGRTLADRLAEGPLSVASTLVVATDVLRALHDVHLRQIVHRDIKPANVVVAGGEPLSAAVLIDFGLSRSGSLDNALRDQAVGTARYLAPEQAGLVDAAVDERSDLYSLGVVLYECLAGRPPFEAPTVGEVLRQHLSLAPPGLRAAGVGVPRALEALVLRLLGKDQAQRYQSAVAALADVEQIAAALRRGVVEPKVVVGLHDRRSTLTEPAFVGRGAELEALGHRLDEARGGHGGLVLLEADSGGGKTRLLDELAEQALRGGAWVLRGHGVDQAAQRPYQVLAGMVTTVEAVASGDPSVAARLREEVGDRAEAVVGALPELAAVLRHLGARPLPEAHGETRSIAALVALLGALGTSSRPALVLLDDCQWADALTVRLLGAWQERASEHGANVLVVAAFRSEEVGRDHALRWISRADTVLLRPLATDEIRDLAESMAGPLPGEALATVSQLAEGSPFMAGAVLRGLVECGALVDSPTGWAVERDALADVQTSRRAALFLVRRLELLSPPALELLSVGAVLGKEFELALAVDLAALRPGEAGPALEEARRRRILWVDDTASSCQFLHDKLREALLGRLDPAERTRLHRRAADHIEALDPTRSFDLAYHFDAAGELGRSLPHALAAAEHARGQHTLDIAEAHYRMAERAAAGADSETRRRVAEGLGDVLTLRGTYAQAVEQFELAGSLTTDPVAGAALQVKIGDVAFKCGAPGHARSVLEGALRQLGGRVPRTSAGAAVSLVRELVVQVAHTLAPRLFVGRRSTGAGERELLALRLYSRLAYVYWFHSGKLRCAWAHLREMNLAERRPPSRELAQAYSEHAPVMTMVPMYRRGIEYARRSHAIRTELGDVWGQGQSLGFHSAVLYSASRYRESVDRSREAMRLLERTGDRWEANTAGWHLALALYRLGDLGEAVAVARRVHDEAVEIGDQAAAGISLSAWARAAEGDIPAAVVHAELDRQDDDAHTGAEVRLAEAVRLMAAGKPAAAVDILRVASRVVREAGLRQEYVAPILPWLATALRVQAEELPTYARNRRRLLREARRTARRACRLSRSYRNNRPHALREHGMLAAMGGRRRAARRSLDASLAWARAQGARFEEAQTLLARGQIGSAVGWVDAAADLEVASALLTHVRAGRGGGAMVVEEVTLSLADRFSTLLDVGRAIASATSPVAVYEAVQRAALTLLRGDECHVLEIGPEDGTSVPTVSGQGIDRLSRTAVQRAIATGAPVVANSAGELDATESLVLADVRSLLCAPIACDGKPTACFYVTHGRVDGLFGAEEEQLASFVATLAGAALEHVAGSEARFRSLAQNSSDVVTIVDASGAVTYQSSSVERVFGFAPPGLVGTSVGEWAHPDDRAAIGAVVDAARRGGVPDGIVPCRLRCRDGSYRHTESVVTNLFDDPSVGGAVLNTRDVTERHQLEEELRRRAWHDPLTDLPNRALFTDRVEHALARSARDDLPSVVLYLDLDDFKSVNDSLGHHAGDVLLRTIADRLLACVRPGDTVARLGGDEFAVLLDGAPLADAETVAERIVTELGRPFRLPGGERRIHVSVGIAAGRPGVDTADELVTNADTAMFAAKKKGKDRAQVFAPSMRTMAVEAVHLRAELETALDRDEMAVFYQPIVSVETGRMVCAEALVRWRHPRLGLLGPADFIPLAEASGLIVPIGAWVLRQACVQARAWQQAHPSAAELEVSVNLAARQLQSPDLVADVAAALDESGLDARRLTLEITESAMVDDSDVTAGRIEELKALGVRLSIDDFGTGYSSLSYLRRFNVDVLKIDRSFIANMTDSDEAAALVWAIASLGRALRLEVVAEGVETLAQLEALTSLGCHRAQGFNWSRPVPAPMLDRWLRVPDQGGRPATGTADGQVRVLLVDDQDHVRGALGIALGATERFRVVAEAASGQDALEMAAVHQPDLVLLDERMPGMSGHQALPGILAAAPGATVVFLTSDAAGARSAGGPPVAAFIDKACDFDRLVDLLAPLTA